ncbi:MAG TPA: adenosine deaminase [Terriglobia bacterium]|nr:adenosine deaminase [Terriglobia bacterium]
MMCPHPTPIETFISRLPKVELHLHLEGSVLPETLRELSRAKGRLHQETEDWIVSRLRTNFRYQNSQEFLNAFKLVTLLLESPQDYALATTRLCERLAEQNVKYAEVTLSVGVILWKKQAVDAIFEAILAAASDAEARLRLRVRWIFDAIRHFGAEHARQVLAWARRFRSQGVVAYGIGGDELRGPAELFIGVYREARDYGLHITAHAGESAGAQSVRAAIELLGAERIGHGFTAARDPAVLAILRDRQIPLEVCPSSNVCTGLVPRFEDHPLLKFIQEGLFVTLNSDDPGLFGTSLEREFVMAAKYFALSTEQLVRLSENAIRASFLAEEKKVGLLEDLYAVTRPGPRKDSSLHSE